MVSGLDHLARRLAALRLAEDAPPRGERRAAVAMVLRPSPAGPEVLLMRRIEHPRDRWSGQISLPGGHAEEGDADLLATAVRETREEVGIDLARSGRLLGQLERVRAKARGRLLEMSITPFVFSRVEDVEPVPGIEAQEVFWFPLERAASGELDAVHRYEGRHPVRRTLELPSWRFGERVIWGLTHEMLTALLRAIS
jgi:8-oxo-dGTP pyrophosphatase MutT (NUDIX family)